ncbi:MAG: hypothetical protein AAF928_04990 [Myxococcota bacterium]
MTFRILAHQMDALGAQTRADFHARVLGYLRAHLPTHRAAVGDDDAWMVDALAFAHRYGIETEPEVFQLIVILTDLGLDADERYPWVAAALGDRALLPEGKLRRLIVDGCTRHPNLEGLLVIARYREALIYARDAAPDAAVSTSP